MPWIIKMPKGEDFRKMESKIITTIRGKFVTLYKDSNGIWWGLTNKKGEYEYIKFDNRKRPVWRYARDNENIWAINGEIYHFTRWCKMTGKTDEEAVQLILKYGV